MLGDQLRSLRKQKKMSQAELSKQLYVSHQAVGKWERNEATPNPETITKLAQILEVTTDELLGTEKPASHVASDSDTISEDALKAAFWGGDKNLSQDDLDAMWTDVKNFADFLAQQKKRERQKND